MTSISLANDINGYLVTKLKTICHKIQKKLLEGPQKCLVQEGFRKKSVKAIARYAGVNHGLVQHYFGSKEELLAALIEAVASGESLPYLVESNVVPVTADGDSVLTSAGIGTFSKNKLVPHLTSDYNKLVLEMLIMSLVMTLVVMQRRILLNSLRAWFRQILGTQDPALLVLISGALMGLMFQDKLDSSIDEESAVTHFFSMIVKNK